uniref:BTB domain-containing protein n=1 Tax=Panagrellus redivivus TaxID=6233 RepID=A0A7E4VNM2_PANRE
MAKVVRDSIRLSINEVSIDNLDPKLFVSVKERRIENTDLKWTLPTFDRRFSTGETELTDFETASVGEKGFVKCEIEFVPLYSGVTLPNSTIEEFFKDAPRCESDAEIVVGNNRIKVHRYMLSLMSPVFQAYFQHDTQESQTGVINITDFEFQTVKNVIDFAYGRDIEEKPISEIIGMLQFADKYDIKTITKLENCLHTNLHPETFSTLAQHAWSFDNKELQTKCAQYYRDNVQVIALRHDFVELTPEVQNAVIRAAALQPPKP